LKRSIKIGRRYETTGLEEAQYQPRSHGRVLRNLLGITRKREMDRTEVMEQLRGMSELVDRFDRDHRFTANDICEIHRIWLGPLYAWAGKYRKVNLTKDGFPFAAAGRIQRLMGDFEKNTLAKFTPCKNGSIEAIIHALTVVHTEPVLIHPFREGNGRVARMLASIMSLQAGLPALDFGGIKGPKRQEYFASVQPGMSGDYRPMERIFTSVIRRTSRRRT
jgi:cell filamentation protein, protein adenylyltransferase